MSADSSKIQALIDAWGLPMATPYIPLDYVDNSQYHEELRKIYDEISRQ